LAHPVDEEISAHCVVDVSEW